MINKAFESLNLTGLAPLLLICDHASNHVPAELENLGLTEDQLARHIGWDIGAATITRKLSETLGAAAILSGTSRLVIDANRPQDDPSGIPEISDQTVIPGNQKLSKAEKNRRVEAYFWPYHHAISTEVEQLSQRNASVPAIFSIHTFTPSLPSKNEPERPWHAGILWNKDPRIAEPLMAHLRRHPDKFTIGDNEPYSGTEVYYSVDHNAGDKGLPHAAIEVRQDLVNTPDGAAYWANIIADCLTEILGNPEIHQIKRY